MGWVDWVMALGSPAEFCLSVLFLFNALYLLSISISIVILIFCPSGLISEVVLAAQGSWSDFLV